MSQTQTAFRFADLNIKPSQPAFVGDKIKIDRVLNREITISRFKIEPSKYPEKGNGMRLVMQVKIGTEDKIIFTGSTVLQEMIQEIPKDKFPVVTTIQKDNDRLVFT